MINREDCKAMQNLRNVFGIIKKLNYIMNDKQKRKAVYVMFIMVVSAFFELLGVSIIMPFIEALTNQNQLRSRWYYKRVEVLLGETNGINVLIIAGIFVVAIYLIKNAFMIYSYHVQFDYSSRVSMELSQKMLNAYMSKPYDRFIDFNSAEVLRGCTTDTLGVFIVIHCLTEMIAEFLSIFFIALFLIKTDIFMAVSVISIMGLILLCMMISFKPIFKKIGRQYLDVTFKKNKIINQMVGGIQEIFANKREKLFFDEYKTVSDEERIINRKKETLNASPDRITEAICVCIIMALLIIRLGQQDDASLFVPQLAVFAMAAFRVFPSVGKIAARINILIYNNPALDSVYKNFKEAELYEEGKLDLGLEAGENIAENRGVFTREIVFDRVSYRYPSGEKLVIDGLDLTIKKGQSIGIIGESGGGKSTLIDILLGLLQPQSGNVIVDGKNLSQIGKEWARQVGYVPQSIFILDGTVKENVLFGLEYPALSTKEVDNMVWEALKMAQIDDYIRSLPDKLETFVGERGVKLSGGQRQRLVLARALLQKPNVLILDEATAALDNDTEQAVIDAIESLHGQITLVIVAHRLTTIMGCDCVYEIARGKAVLISKEELLEGI